MGAMTFELLQSVKVLPGAVTEWLPKNREARHEAFRMRGLVVGIPSETVVLVMWSNGSIGDFHPDDLWPAPLG